MIPVYSFRAATINQWTIQVIANYLVKLINYLFSKTKFKTMVSLILKRGHFRTRLELLTFMDQTTIDDWTENSSLVSFSLLFWNINSRIMITNISGSHINVELRQTLCNLRIKSTTTHPEGNDQTHVDFCCSVFQRRFSSLDCLHCLTYSSPHHLTTLWHNKKWTLLLAVKCIIILNTIHLANNASVCLVFDF